MTRGAFCGYGMFERARAPCVTAFGTFRSCKQTPHQIGSPWARQHSVVAVSTKPPWPGLVTGGGNRTKEALWAGVSNFFGC